MPIEISGYKIQDNTQARALLAQEIISKELFDKISPQLDRGDIGLIELAKMHEEIAKAKREGLVESVIKGIKVINQRIHS